jgi:hypothetical protein
VLQGYKLGLDTLGGIIPFGSLLKKLVFLWQLMQ